MHNIFFATQHNVRFPLAALNKPGNPFKLLIYLNLFGPVYLLSKPVGSLIFKAWRCGR